MSIAYFCDYCGEDLDGDWVELNVVGSRHLYHRTGYMGHYHDECWLKVRDAIRLAHAYGPTLETIPTISGQAVAQRRRKHHKPADDEGEQ